MPSKMVTDRQKSSHAVQAAVQVNAEEVLERLTSTLQPTLADGEEMPDLGLFQELVRRWLQAATARLVQADQAHDAELSDDASARATREEAEFALRDALGRMRSTARGVFGVDAESELLHLSGNLAQDPASLLRQALNVLERLRSPDLELPEPLLEGVSVDPARWVQLLDGPTRDLQSALDDVTAEERQAESTLTEKSQALDSYDDVFQRSAALLEALYAFAGRKDLAQRVRPSARKPGQTLQEPPEPSSP